MKRVNKTLLLAIAIIVGGGLGYKLLANLEPAKILLFAAACLILGQAFYQIDRKLSKRSR